MTSPNPDRSENGVVTSAESRHNQMVIRFPGDILLFLPSRRGEEWKEASLRLMLHSFSALFLSFIVLDHAAADLSSPTGPARWSQLPVSTGGKSGFVPRRGVESG